MCYRRLIAVAFAACIGSPMAWALSPASGVSPQAVSLPSGPGSITGLGTDFSSNPSTGSGRIQIPIGVPAGTAGTAPALSLDYDSGRGNGLMGMGWRLTLPSVRRTLVHRLPSYDDARDRFEYDGTELVRLADGTYRPRYEGRFVRLSRLEQGWEAAQPNGNRLRFGLDASARIESGLGVFSWEISEWEDRNGNRMTYHYEAGDGRPYLREIRYGYGSDGAYRSVLLTYESRPDPLTDYRSRARVVTDRRLAGLEIRSRGRLVSAYRLSYEEGTRISLLAAIRVVGSDGVTSLPPVTFAYSPLTLAPDNLERRRVVIMSDPPPAGISLASSDVDLVDIDGDALPDLVYTDPASDLHRYFVNVGGFAWAAEERIPPASPPYRLSSPGVRVLDVDGDAAVDLVVATSGASGHYRGSSAGYWDEADWRDSGQDPGLGLDRPSTRTLDLDGDRRIDVMRAIGSDTLAIWLSQDQGTWSDSADMLKTPPDGLDLDAPSTRLADLNGDGLLDLVQVLDGTLRYWPSMGLGDFDSAVDMRGAPEGFGSIDRLDLIDLDGDGRSDAVEVGNGYLRLWLNRGDGAFDLPVLLEGTPEYSADESAYRFADMDGDGLLELLITKEGSSAGRYQWVRLGPVAQPYLMTEMGNGLGAMTRIRYRSTTLERLAAESLGEPWRSTLPLTVQVVASIEVEDGISGTFDIAKFEHRDPYYDPGEARFAGFREVSRTDSGDGGIPSLRTVMRFDVGELEPSRRGMVVYERRESAAATVSGELTAPFDEVERELATRYVAESASGEPVRFSFVARELRRVFEQTDTPIELLVEYDYDDYGNQIRLAEYGAVPTVGETSATPARTTTTVYDPRLDEWILDRVAQITVQDISEHIASAERFEYDRRGNLIGRDALLDDDTWARLLSIEPDAHGNPMRITDANGHWRQVDYDPVFHTYPIRELVGGLGLEMIHEHDLDLGQLVASADANGHRTEMRYDVLGRLTALILPGDSPEMPTQSFEYLVGTPYNRIISHQRERSGVSQTLDRMTLADGSGRPLMILSEAGAGAWAVTNAVEYGARSRVQREWQPYFLTDPQTPAPPEGWAAIRSSYDAIGRVVETKQPDGSISRIAYAPLRVDAHDEEDTNPDSEHFDTPQSFISDGFGRLIEVIERNGNAHYSTRYDYDALDRLTELTDAMGNRRTLAYDRLGRLVQEQHPDRGVRSWTYDLVGNVLVSTDAKAQAVHYAYDGANRPVSETFQGIERIRFHYDEPRMHAGDGDDPNTAGRVAWIRDDSGTTAFAYDARGNLIRRLTQVQGDFFEIRSRYDAMSRPTHVEYGHLLAFDYRYGINGQLAEIPGWVDLIRYDASGRKIEIRHPNGLSRRWGYDDRGRLVEQGADQDGRALLWLGLDYDRVGNMVAITDRLATDGIDRSRVYRYDALYRLRSSVGQGVTEGFAYDPLGNLIQRSSLGALRYGGDGRGPHALASASGRTFGYDANGNLTSDGDRAFLFDYRDRLIQVTSPDGAATRFVYDYDGSRRIKRRGEDVKRFPAKGLVAHGGLLSALLQADGDLLGEIGVGRARASPEDADNQPRDGRLDLDEIRALGGRPDLVECNDLEDAVAIYRRYRDGPEWIAFDVMAAAVAEAEPAGCDPERSVRFLVADYLGSVIDVRADSGDDLEQIQYEPYGSELGVSMRRATEYRFTGAYEDDGLGLYQFGARYYQPEYGRFLSVDPVGLDARTLRDPQAFNAYSYARGNPIRYVDPRGLAPIEILDIWLADSTEAMASGPVRNWNGAWAGDSTIGTVSTKLTGSVSYIDVPVLTSGTNAQLGPVPSFFADMAQGGGLAMATARGIACTSLWNDIPGPPEHAIFSATGRWEPLATGPQIDWGAVIDTTLIVADAATVGIAVASLYTPYAPLAVPALMANRVVGIASILRAKDQREIMISGLSLAIPGAFPLGPVLRQFPRTAAIGRIVEIAMVVGTSSSVRLGTSATARNVFGSEAPVSRACYAWPCP